MPCYTKATIKAKGLTTYATFLGIDRCVEVGETLPDKAVTVTFKSVPHAGKFTAGVRQTLFRCPTYV